MVVVICESTMSVQFRDATCVLSVVRCHQWSFMFVLPLLSFYFLMLLSALSCVMPPWSFCFVMPIIAFNIVMPPMFVQLCDATYGRSAL